MQKLHELSDKRLVAILNLLTEQPNGDADCVRLAVRIRAELGNRAADTYAEIYAPSATAAYRELRESE